jgi:hypothetical protein
MKSRTRVLEARLKKLETIHNPPPIPSYVVRLSEHEAYLPDTEQRRIIAERSGGRPVAVMPEVCATSGEWVERCKRELAHRATHH